MLHRRPALRAPVEPNSSVSITFKGLGAYDYSSAFRWPPPQDQEAANQAECSGSHGQRHTSGTSVSFSIGGNGDHVTYYRSPFSVLRSRQSCVNRCAAGVLGTSFDTSTSYSPSTHKEAPCSKTYCCCSALMYPAISGQPLSARVLHTEAVERVRDDFLWALKIGGVEDLLWTTLGEDLHARLMEGLGASPVVVAVLACSDPVKMASLMSNDSTTSTVTASASPTSTTSVGPAQDAAFVARLLLSADEDNRIRWLQEESASMVPSDYYSRAPSLRALFVMWSLLQHQEHARSTAVHGSGCSEDSRHNINMLNRDSAGDGSGGRESWGGESSRYNHNSGPRVRNPASARSPSSLVPRPRMGELRHVLLRMEERRMEVMMSDIAALAAIGAGGTGATAVPDSEFWDSLAKLLKPQEVAAALRTLSEPLSTSSSASAGYAATAVIAVAEETLGLKHVLLLCLLLRYVLQVRAEVAQREVGAASQPLSPSALALRNNLLLPMSAFEAASHVIQLRKSLMEGVTESDSSFSKQGHVSAGRRAASAIRDTIVVLSDAMLKHAYEMAETSHIPSSSPDLLELTTWLLREMVSSPACEFHFKRLVDRSITEALVALEKSGLVNRSTIDLKVVVQQLLPLLESCGSENLYTSVLRDVLSALEDRVRRNGFAFPAEDLQYLAELGTKLFSSGLSDSTAGGYGLFDETARGQMEELHVMDGSPWALCVSSYRSLKEMLQGIVRDQRRLKEQVQDQLRQFSNASSLSAVMNGTGGEVASQDSARTTKVHPSSISESSKQDSFISTSGSSFPCSRITDRPHAIAQEEEKKDDADPCNAVRAKEAAVSPTARPRIPVSPMLRQRFLVLIEHIVKSQVDESSADSEKPIVVSSELFAFVTQHVPVPNIQDEYRRKIFLLVNVAEDPETARQRTAHHREDCRRRLRRGVAAKAGGVVKLRRASRSKAKDDGVGGKGGDEEEGVNTSAPEKGGKTDPKNGVMDTDPHGGANEIPAELRFLVSSLPLTLSPWASVMILREVLAESAGRNPRYTYVLNAAIDLQLPMSTTRSRIATTLNMWRFLNTQSHKLSLKESLVMKQRCAWNLPLSYILSSYWSLLTWLALASIITLNVVGVDWESQIVANSLFRMFAPWEEICATPSNGESTKEAWTTQATADLAADYFEQAEIADRRREEHCRSNTNVFLSSASYLILGYDDQRRPMTIIPIGSDRTESAETRVAEEYAAATAVLRELSLHAPFPFFVDIERALPLELVEMRIAERIRRISFNNTWFLPRMIIRTFPLGRQYTEHKLILHTCTQANLTRRRVTFLLYIHDGVAVTPQFIRKLNESYLCKHANLVLVVHESSLLKGGTTPASLATISQVNTSSSAESLESIASAAANIIEAVLPKEVRGSATGNPYSAGASSSSAADREVRVLPLCRQYYSKDGTAVSDAVRGRAKLAEMNERIRVDGAVGDTEGNDGGWWQRLASCVPRSSKLSSEAAAAAEAASSLPLFASAFSAQRVSLYRSHRQQQCEAEDAVARLQQEYRQQQGSVRRTVALLGQWMQWWKRTLSGATATATGPLMRGSLDDSREEGAEEGAEATRHGRGDSTGANAHESADTTAATMKTQQGSTTERSFSADSYPSGFRDDAMEERAGRNVVSVCFTALRHLMAEVSAPVPIPRRKSVSSSSASSTVATTEVAEGEGGGRGLCKNERLPASAFSAPPEKKPVHFWTSYCGPTTGLTTINPAGTNVTKGKEEASAAVMSTSPPPSIPVATLLQPYSSTFNASSANSNSSGNNNNTCRVKAELSNVASRAKTSPPAPIVRAAIPATAAATEATTALATTSPRESLLPAADLARPNGFEWGSEWFKAGEMLAQLDGTTPTNM